jgi:hypothetical protein
MASCVPFMNPEEMRFRSRIENRIVRCGEPLKKNHWMQDRIFRTKLCFPKDEDHPGVRSKDPHFLRLVRARKTACKVWKSSSLSKFGWSRSSAKDGAIDRADSVAITFDGVTDSGVWRGGANRLNRAGPIR